MRSYSLHLTEYKSGSEKWETREETPGIWVTQLKRGLTLDADDDSSSPDGATDALAVPEALDGAGPAEETVTLTNEYDLSHDEPASEEVDPDEYSDESEPESDPPCNCEKENMCLACMTKPDAEWGESDIDELEDDEGVADQTSLISEDSESNHSSDIGVDKD